MIKEKNMLQTSRFINAKLSWGPECVLSPHEGQW